MGCIPPGNRVCGSVLHSNTLGGCKKPRPCLRNSIQSLWSDSGLLRASTGCSDSLSTQSCKSPANIRAPIDNRLKFWGLYDASCRPIFLFPCIRLQIGSVEPRILKTCFESPKRHWDRSLSTQSCKSPANLSNPIQNPLKFWGLCSTSCRPIFCFGGILLLELCGGRGVSPDRN